jgi:hypothetical protein
MILTAIGKGANAGALYPEFVGRRALFVGSGTGPTLYNSTTGDVVTLAVPNYYIDAIPGGVQTVSGTYWVQPRPSGTGARQTWALHWFVTSTGAEAGAINLSAESVQLGAFVGQF